MATLISSWSMSSLTGWTQDSGTWATSGGWATATGNWFGRPTLYRSSGLASNHGYIECDYYGTGALGDRWGMFGLGWAGGGAEAYANVGYTMIVRHPPGQLVNLTYGDPGYVPKYSFVVAPVSPATAVRIGLHVDATKHGKIFVNGECVDCGDFSNSHDAEPTRVVMGVHHTVTGYFRNVEVWDEPPYSPSACACPGTSPISGFHLGSLRFGSRQGF